jgi:hypothetical protein
MHLSRLLLLGSLAFLPVVQAADEIAEPVCEEKTVPVEQIPRGFVCDERAPSACPSAGNLSCIGRTDTGTRFWIDSSMVTTGPRLSLEQLREFEAALQSFRRPQAIDPSETVIRVYDADGKHYEERKVRFSALPRDFVLDAQPRSQKTASYPAPGEVVEAAIESSLAGGGLDPRSFFPIELAPTLAVSGPCQ